MSFNYLILFFKYYPQTTINISENFINLKCKKHLEQAPYRSLLVSLLQFLQRKHNLALMGRRSICKHISLIENLFFIEREFNTQAKKIHPALGRTPAGWK